MRRYPEGRERSGRSRSQLSVYINAFTSAPLQKVVRQPLKGLRMVLISPKESGGRTVPELGKRRLGLEDVRRVWKFCTVPQIAAGRAKNADTSLEIEIQSGSLVVSSIHHDHI